MKTSTRTLALGAAIVGLALSAAPSLAQGRGARGQGTPPSPEQRAKARAEMLETLDLSADQKTQVTAVFTALDTERKTLFDAAREGGDREAMKAMRDKVKGLQDSADGQLKSILSEDQYAKYVELRASRQGARGDRPGQSAGDRPGQGAGGRQ